MHRRIPVVLAAGLLATTTALTLTGTAQADPSATLKKTDIAGVGSDTTQYVMDAVSTQFNKTSKTKKLGSWDAIPPAGGSTTITTKAGCAPITRPNGGSAGVAALLADTSGCIDFARTISPKATDGTQDSLSFYAYGQDGVSWATVPAAKGKPKTTPASLTTDQLAAIYSCQTTNWTAIDGTLPSNPIHVFLPQAGSALRKTFLARIGLTDSTVGSCVNQTAEQNKGTALGGDKLAIVPHSIASYLAQSNKKVPDARGGIVLRQINGKKPTTSDGKLNGSFDPNFLFLIYNVVKSPITAAESKIFTKSGFICKNPKILTNYGFNPIGAACGSVS